MTESVSHKIPLRTQLAVFGSGMFADGATNVVIPLWVITLQPTAFEFGMVIGARALLPFLFSIHGGVLMDRLGARQVMLFFAFVGLVLPILFPILPWVWAAAVLQLITGLTTTMSWVGAQTVVGQTMKGQAGFASRLSFSNRLGGLVCPLIAGASWDAFGPWGGFGTMFTWSVLLLISALMLPKQTGTQKGKGRPFAVRDMVPRFDDYIRALAMLAIPAVAMVAAASVLNIATGAIQASFYVAYLEKIGFTGTLIGVLVSASNLAGLAGTLGVTRIMHRIGDINLLNATVVIAIITVTTTPFLTSFALLLILSVLRGWSQGAGQPLMISIPSAVVPPGSQGISVGLRISLNRLVQTLLPPAMGAVVGIIGLEESFLVVGGTLLALVGVSLFFLYRRSMVPRERP